MICTSNAEEATSVYKVCLSRLHLAYIFYLTASFVVKVVCADNLVKGRGEPDCLVLLFCI